MGDQKKVAKVEIYLIFAVFCFLQLKRPKPISRTTTTTTTTTTIDSSDRYDKAAADVLVSLVMNFFFAL